MKRSYIIAVVILIWVAAAFAASRLRIDPQITSLLPENAPQVAAMRKIEGMRDDRSDILCLYQFDAPFHDVERIKSTARQINQLGGVLEVIFRRESLTPYHLRMLDENKLTDVRLKVEKYIERKKLEKAGLHIDFLEDDEDISIFANLDEDYLKTKDGRAWLIRIMLEQQNPSDESLDHLLSMVRNISSRTLGNARLSFAGGTFDKYREKKTLIGDLTSTLAFCLVAILIAMLLFLRSAKKILYVTVPLLFGLTIIFGIADILFGSLNMQTIFVGAVLAGLGIDFGIHLTLKSSRNSSTRGSLITACATTALAYLVLLLSSLPGLIKLGILASIGIVVMLLSYFLFYYVFGLSADSSSEHTDDVRHFPFKRALSIAMFAIILLGGCQALTVEYEANFKNLSSRQRIDDKSVRDIINDIRGNSGIHTLVYLDDLKDAVEFNSKMRGLSHRDEISEYSSMGSLIRKDEKKEAIIADLRKLLLVENRKHLSKDQIRRLGIALALPKFELKSIPMWIKEKYAYNDDGPSVGVIQAAEGMVGHERQTEEFQKAVSKIRLGGKPAVAVHEALMINELTEKIQEELPLLIGGACSVVLLILIIRFRSIGLAVLTMVPLLGGLSALGICMSVFGMKINPFNLSILPVLIGIGVDDGIYIVNGYRKTSPRAALRSSFLAITLTSITSGIGFGSLLLAQNVGLFSVGMVGLIGIASLWLCTVLFLPALLELYDRLIFAFPRRRGWWL